jgi:hypothetical protein
LKVEAERVLRDVRIVHRVIDTLHGDRRELGPSVADAAAARRTATLQLL